ncbi:hypothetical protein Aduo_010608 [Ancylostoma duodenale]
MTELAAFKTLPTRATECTIFIVEKMAEVDEVKLSLAVLVENLKNQIDVAMTNTMAKKEQSERERLMNDLDAFLNTEAYETEIIAIQWTGRLKYRLGELQKQSSLIQSRSITSGVTSARDTDRDSTLSPIRHIENKMRLPQLEVHVFSGSYRDYPTFWTIYDSLIHSNQQLTNMDKFPFLRQALKGRAATLLGNMPAIAENYEKAIKLLNKRFNKSALQTCSSQNSRSFLEHRTMQSVADKS